MKLLRIKAEGLPLYKKTFDISFYALQRVQSNHLNTLHNLFGNIYVNTAEAFIGINASGKTTALKIISFACMLLSAQPINNDYAHQLLEEGTPAVFDINFYIDGKIYHLCSEIIKTRNSDGSPAVRIISEKLWMKPVSSRINKTNLLDFSNLIPVRVRDDSDEYLSEDVSIMIAVKKQYADKSLFVDLALFTDFNLFLTKMDSIPTEIVTLLDPTIEYIRVEHINNKVFVKLKFFSQKEPEILQPAELNFYLSSGTIKGIRVFSDAARVLKNGGYLVVDEIENHFNHELVSSLIRLFMNQKTNPHGAVIIFSTHYPELLDELERNDSIFITRSDNGLTIDNLNSLLNRNDLNKSELYQSNYLGGTAPKYKAVSAMQKWIISNQEA